MIDVPRINKITKYLENNIYDKKYNYILHIITIKYTYHSNNISL